MILCLAISGIGGAVTATSVGSWYQTLQRPSFNPPDWAFAPVWTMLYIFIAVAGWRVWRRSQSSARTKALAIYGLQLGLNLAWSFLFFGFQHLGLVLVEITFLLVVIATTTFLFWRIDRLAGALFVPYFLWVGFATALNAALWLLN